MLRADAEENRELILAAAKGLFAERGITVPMREVARVAGVGPATLYRRFPTRQALIDAAFRDELRACRAVVEEGCADPDPWRGFCTVLLRIGELNARNQGFVDAFMSTFPDGGGLSSHRMGLLRSLAGLCHRAQAAGALRSDFVFDDLVLALMAGRGITATTSGGRLAASRRFAALMIDAFRASGTD